MATTSSFQPTTSAYPVYNDSFPPVMAPPSLRQQILEFYNETRAFERKVGIIIPSIFTVVIIVGLLGNLLVIVVALNRQMRNSTNTLIIGLACSDLMFLTLCVPFTAIDYAFPVWVLPTWTCNMINYLQHASAYFSVWTLTLMAADRFLAVCYPVESMTLRSPANTFIALCSIYGVILLTQVQVARIHDVYNYTFVVENRSACSIVSIAKGEASVTEARLYFFSFNIFGYVFPLGITCFFYYFMLKRLWYTPKPGGGGGSTKNSTIRAKRKVTRLVLCVVVIWALCWLPLNICFFFSGLVYPDTLVLKGGKPIVIIQISSQVLAYTNSCLNPILYPLVSENFRKGFLRIICLILNWVTCGHFCQTHKNFRYNSRMEVTNFNNNSKSRSSTNRMSRTNSSSNRTNTITNQPTIGENSSLLIRSSVVGGIPPISGISLTSGITGATTISLPNNERRLSHRHTLELLTAKCISPVPRLVTTSSSLDADKGPDFSTNNSNRVSLVITENVEDEAEMEDENV
ncbi:7 transmembrane receptor (rhodopsin family) domain-containing protein [Ditylenchus destructor]|uniref:7 transmembrane receptor (Rhodopsin family) domain-containing protein n=1 Tax=Ditylenchus destructor TaxID=166010 RepID=A0AAD4NCR8_9BILA|nr:7 transmembrane receptor (rhodopsin family) domain-containing protein [Ditylenchus destructor]